MQVRRNFELAGGKIYEFTAAEGVEVFDNGCSMILPEGNKEGPQSLVSRLLIDCMGNASPIVRQVGSSSLVMRDHKPSNLSSSCSQNSFSMTFQGHC